MTIYHCTALLIWGLSTLFAFRFLQTGWYGAWLGYYRWGSMQDDPITLITFSRHKRAAKSSAWTMVVAIFAIEGARKLLMLPYIPFFRVHLPLLLLFAPFFLLTFWYNGEKHPRAHKFFAIPALLLGSATIVTGDMLVYLLLWR